MSGTSLDGVDAALVTVTGGVPPAAVRLEAFYTRPYTGAERARLRAVLRPRVRLDALTIANAWLGDLFADAALAVIAQAGLAPRDIDAIGSHGQTVWHHPPAGGAPGATLQLGEPCVIAERTGVLTVADFRPRDMAAGGHGAPLVPFTDFLQYRSETESRLLLNIGGIANVTYLPRGCAAADVLAFDTGPGNLLLDGYLRRATRGRLTYDVDGRLAATGTVRADLLDALLAHPYFAAPPPKSTGREAFGDALLASLALPTAPAARADIAVTLTAVTAESVARAVRDFVLPRGPVDVLVVGGGGAYNPTLMAGLAARLPGLAVVAQDTLGTPAAAKEAVAFALLAHATLCGAPGTLPAATGAAHPVVLGKIVPGA
jgi:anhydro-N-acetylmuramic acid kinase